MAEQRYTVFKRSYTDWKSFANARKITVARNVSGETARHLCDDYNENHTAAQKRRGTKMEFTS